MTASRIIPTSATPGLVTGDSFMDAVQAELTALYNNSHLHLTNVAGDGNAITATLAPDLTGSLVAGMKFSFLPNAANADGGVTLSINGGTGVAVVNGDGDPLIANQLLTGRLVSVEFDGTALRLEGSSGLQKIFRVDTYTANGTWTRPVNVDLNGLFIAQLWGAGGAGSSSNQGSGGSGAAYRELIARIGDLPASLDVIVPGTTAIGGTAGAAVLSEQGTVYAIAYGGRNGGTGSGTDGGYGAAGASPHGPGREGGSSVNPPYSREGGEGGVGATEGVPPGDGQSGVNWGGGGGGGGSRTGVNTDAGDGGNATWGGGGGAGAKAGNGAFGIGGTSIYGGNGGDTNIDGSPRGGGGGRNAQGGRGEIIIRVIG